MCQTDLLISQGLDSKYESNDGGLGDVGTGECDFRSSFQCGVGQFAPEMEE